MAEIDQAAGYTLEANTSYQLLLLISLPLWVEYSPPFMVPGDGRTLSPLDVKKAAQAVFPSLGIESVEVEPPGIFEDVYELYIRTAYKVDLGGIIGALKEYLKESVNKYIKIEPKGIFVLTEKGIEEKAKESFTKGLKDIFKKVAFLGGIGLVLMLLYSPPFKALFRSGED